MKYFFSFFICIITTLLISCHRGKSTAETGSEYDLVSLLDKFDNRVRLFGTIDKTGYIRLLKEYRSLADSIAVSILRDTTSADVHQFTLISVRHSELAHAMCLLSDSCSWTFSDLPAIFAQLNPSSEVRKSNVFYDDAVAFFSSLDDTSSGNRFSSWSALVQDYVGFLSAAADTTISTKDDFLDFLALENRYYISMLSQLRYAEVEDMASIVEKTEIIGDRLISCLTVPGLSPRMIRTYMLVRANHRFMQNLRYGLMALSDGNALPHDKVELSLSLLLSPFLCMDSELVAMRTDSQCAELIALGDTIPQLFSKYGNSTAFRSIDIMEIPASIVRRTILGNGF